MYTLADRISNTVAAWPVGSKMTIWAADRGTNQVKPLKTAPKTSYFAGILPHCYIMATMRSKLSVYVNINVTERLFFEQKNLREALQASRESDRQPASRTLVSATESFSC
ncbi:hypothetical protein NKI61_28705 [Mesorhizobium sp. M0514]|uniref:hypothetical protein n=1 Tax=Mesorhizobium sp. M0514 TaxID=2956955 RepID=UPI00333B47AD